MGGGYGTKNHGTRNYRTDGQNEAGSGSYGETEMERRERRVQGEGWLALERKRGGWPAILAARGGVRGGSRGVPARGSSRSTAQSRGPL